MKYVTTARELPKTIHDDKSKDFFVGLASVLLTVMMALNFRDTKNFIISFGLLLQSTYAEY